MTIGISKEWLESALLDKECTESTAKVIRVLLKHCKELNPWLPIEDAPLNRRIRLFNTAAKSQVFDCLYTEAFRKYYSHWKELSEDPK